MERREKIRKGDGIREEVIACQEMEEKLWDAAACR